MLISNELSFKISNGGALSITDKFFNLSDVIGDNSLLCLFLELFNRHSQALLGSRLAYVVPGRLDVGYFARVHLLYIVLDESRPCLAIHSMSKHALDRHLVKNFLPETHDLLDKLWSEALNLQLF